MTKSFSPSRARQQAVNRREGGNRVPPLMLALLFTGLFAGFSLLPRVNENARLAQSIWGATAVLLVFLFFLWRAVVRSGRVLSYQFLPIRVHYIQMMMHSCIYIYWGMYWPEVFRHAPLILAQVVFVYALDMLVCWSRRDKWILGFGPFPIIFSTNLFLWFRDDWFWLQFLMVATGVLCKEFIKWEREGRRTHIFNPSAIALFLFSIGLLVSNSTSITWGPEIAKTLHRPPYIYPEIFLIGLVVQGLFSVTLVTLSAAAVLYVLNLAYTQATGVYYFVDSNIPVSVFIGLHLLVTDPATSPRRTTAKIAFGALYGAAVFALYGILGLFMAPQFYDKLLCVPPLNLSVRALDRWSLAFANRFHPFNWSAKWSPRELNFAHMGIWAVLFSFMMATGFAGRQHPGQNIAFWQKACEEGRHDACRTWAHALRTDCENNIASSCLAFGRLVNEGRVVPADRLEAGKALGKACDLGVASGCFEVAESVRTGGANVLNRACDKGDSTACFIMGALYSDGRGVPRDEVRSVALLERACDSGWSRACGTVGRSYLLGRGGTGVDTAKAVISFEKACQAGDGSGCYRAAVLYSRGGGGAVINPALALDRLRKACALGIPYACQTGEGVAIPQANLQTGSGSQP